MGQQLFLFSLALVSSSSFLFLALVIHRAGFVVLGTRSGVGILRSGSMMFASCSEGFLGGSRSTVATGCGWNGEMAGCSRPRVTRNIWWAVGEAGA
jgi:hypothetical protein